MEEQRQRARIGAATAHGSEDRHERVIAFAAAAPPTRFVGYETLRATTGLAAVQPRGRPRAGQARGEPLLRRGRRPGRRLRRPALGRGRGARCVDVYRVGEDQALEVELADGAARGRPSRSRPRSTARPATRRCATTPRPTSCTRRCASGSATHVRQAGSAVRPDKLRFDFTHGQALERRGAARRSRTGSTSGSRRAAPVRWLNMERAEAERLGAMALFGEKYGEWVRVVEVDGRLARALRRHPRRQHRRGRHLQDRLRGLERRQRAPDRGAHRPGGDRLVPRARRASCARPASCSASPQDPLAGARRAAERLRSASEGAPRGRAAAARRGGRPARRRRRRRSTALRVVAAQAPIADQKQLLELANRVQSKLGEAGGRPRRRRRRQGRAGRRSSQRGRGRARASRRRRSSARPRRWSAVAAAGATTWRRRAARTRRSSTRRWRRPGRRSSASSAERASADALLALDHGTARIGCAISDPSGTLATPLPVIEPPEPRAVADLVAEHEVERVVVGLPLHLSGEEGAQAALARDFCAELEALLDVPVETYDERLTTRMAEASRRGGADGGAATRSPPRTCSRPTSPARREGKARMTPRTGGSDPFVDSSDPEAAERERRRAEREERRRARQPAEEPAEPVPAPAETEPQPSPEPPSPPSRTASGARRPPHRRPIPAPRRRPGRCRPRCESREVDPPDRRCPGPMVPLGPLPAASTATGRAGSSSRSRRAPASARSPTSSTTPASSRARRCSRSASRSPASARSSFRAPTRWQAA